MTDWDKRFIDLAHNVSNWSKDPSTQVGAVCVGKNKDVLSTGYNGFPRNISDTTQRLNNRETKYKYIVHAEMNCIYNACLNGVSLEGSTLYVVGLPVCERCSLGIVQVGIKKVVIGMAREEVPERWKESIEFSLRVFDEAGVDYKFKG